MSIHEPATSPSPQAAARPQPVFATLAGLEPILKAARFADIQGSAEAVEFVYAPAEEFWLTLGSHNMRASIARIEQAAADGTFFITWPHHYVVGTKLG